MSTKEIAPEPGLHRAPLRCRLLSAAIATQRHRAGSRTLPTLAPRLAAPIIFVLALVLALNHRSGGIIGAAIALAVMGAIIGIEVPLVLRSQRRRQAGRLRQLPNGAFYACRGSASLPHYRMQVTGDRIFDQDGITFTPLRNTQAPPPVHWSEVVRLHLGRSRSQPLAGSLVLDKSDGTKQTFIVRAWGGLAEILAAAPSAASPTLPHSVATAPRVRRRLPESKAVDDSP